MGLAFDANGILFVASMTSPPSIVEIDQNGQTSVFVNSGLQFPNGLAFDRQGNLYVSDWSAQAIFRYDQTGARSTFATGLHGPIGLAFDREGNLFAANQSDNTVVKIQPDGSSSLFANSLMEHPYALAFDRFGWLYVSDGNGLDDPNNDHIARFDRDGNGSVFASGLKVGRGLAFDRYSFLYAADFSHTPLTRFDAAGNRFNVGADAPYAPTFMALKQDATSPQIVSTEFINGEPSVTFMSSAAHGYAVESCDDLVAANWNPITGADMITGTGGPVSIEDSNVSAVNKGFYRVRTLP